jgi:hypothetical protein
MGDLKNGPTGESGIRSKGTPPESNESGTSAQGTGCDRPDAAESPLHAKACNLFEQKTFKTFGEIFHGASLETTEVPLIRQWRRCWPARPPEWKRTARLFDGSERWRMFLQRFAEPGGIHGTQR